MGSLTSITAEPTALAEGEVRKLSPNVRTKSPVIINKGVAPVNFVRYDPTMVAGTPKTTLHKTICQSISFDFQYLRRCYERTRYRGGKRCSDSDKARDPNQTEKRCGNRTAALPEQSAEKAYRNSDN